ncbi:CCA tRNA nucleotidyltransferase [Xanthobacter sp. KR7-225]|uniref:CCA tRNA nucleotidyltransferase n=1 Tax=Xanthobacter sp. KR7-225 TaxID=3156613 RepID=UPI0032B3E1C6
MSGRPLAGADFWGRAGLAELLALLNRDGEEARVVGGAVRNTLLGLPVTDVDVATTALPEVVTARARAAGLKAVPTGIAHGTVTVVVGHHDFEVTTLREDTETDGRRAVVRFGRSWAHDAARRDFTINALYATPAGEVVDLVGGLADLARRQVRFIGDAQARIREDYLRILRLFRFHAFYGEGPLDAAALGAVIRLRAGLLGLSRERVRAELLKLLVAPRAGPTLATMSDAGLLQPLLAGIADPALFARLAAAEARHGVAPDAVRRLAALALRVPDDAERLREKLRLSNAEARRLADLAVPVCDGADEAAARRLVYAAGAEAAVDRALLAEARGRADASVVLATARAWTAPKLPVGAAELMARGLKPGPALGAALARVEAAWVAADFPLEPRALDAVMTRALGG